MADCYDAIASSYDVLTASYPHELWLQRLERIAISHGLSGKRLLDVACGTGKSFLPLLRRGYSVTACDISPAMLEVAHRKAPFVPLHEADLRTLPMFGSFDLVTALDDPLNYLLDDSELSAALCGISRNLAPRGLVLFDLNTLAQYRGQFTDISVNDSPSAFVAWHGNHGNRDVCSGGVVEATVDVFTPVSANVWRRASSLHRQRHWPRDTVERLAATARLEILAVCGQRRGVRIDPTLDELVHIKAIYLARKRKEWP